MHDHPDEFVGIQLHVGDAYEVSWSAKRERFYGVSGYPTTWFDGTVEAEGAYTNDNQMYNWYYGIITGRLAVPTDVTVELSVVRVGEQIFDVTATTSIESGGVGKDLRTHIPLVLDPYPSSGDGRWRNCVMDQLGSENYSLAAGESHSFTAQFEITGASWDNREDLKFVAFARDQGSTGPAEIHNSTQLPWPFYLDGDVDRDGDVDIGDLAAILGAYGSCDGEAGYVPEADFNWDQCITLADLATLLGNYGETWP